MIFEEFFKKKRIDLDALQKGRPELFSEFKLHYDQMGEKSFDHTKKYWFNKIRREYPLAVEAKTEKVKIDNPLAEQTITESLIENNAPTPKLGFVPKFKAAGTPKPAPTEIPKENKTVDQPETIAAPKLGFKPKFKAASMPKPEEIENAEENKTADQPEAITTPKLGFKPKFKAANMPKPDAVEASEENKTADQPESPTPASKLGFKPKFKPAMPANVEQSAEGTSAEKIEDAPAPTPEESAPKPVYKPRFNMKNLPKKEEE